VNSIGVLGIMNDATPKLEPKNLFEKRASRDKARLRAYNQMLEQIHHRIFTTSQLPGNPNYLMYTVPPFILGLPSIDLEDCIVYIVFQLRTSGFEVRFTYPNLLYISWKSYEREYLMTKNPIVQAMIPLAKPEATNKRATGPKSKVQFLTPGAAPGPQEPAKVAAEYTPPASFLTTMERPQNPPRSGATGAGNILADLWNFT
jgi:hypothetical protein